MMERVKSWWVVRTPRERWLLLFLAGLATLMLGWFAIVRPLDLMLADARLAHARALDAEASARQRVARLAMLRAATRLPPPSPLAGYVDQSAQSAGFAGISVTAESPMRVRVSMPTARPQALFGWIETLRARGLVVQSATLRPASGPTVSVDLVLAAGRVG